MFNKDNIEKETCSRSNNMLFDVVHCAIIPEHALFGGRKLNGYDCSEHPAISN